jgi:hypothetical protein
MRGQVNLLLLLLLSGMAAAALRRHSWRAGLWLAGAICLKIIPAYLLVYPLWRRDWRFVASTGLGLVVGLVIVPSLAFGPKQTLAYFQEWDQVLGRPALSSGADQSRAKELIEVTATDSQSFLAVIHNSLNFDRATRPGSPTTFVRTAHWVVGGLLTGLLLLVGGRQTIRTAESELLLLGSLFILMILLSPVCHLHYFCLAVPLLTGLLAICSYVPPIRWADTGGLVVLGLIGVAFLLPHFPGLELVRDLGLAMYAAMLLWLIAIVLIWTRQGSGQSKEKDAPAPRTMSPAA